VKSEQIYSSGNESIILIENYASDGLMVQLEQDIPWKQNQIRIFGKPIDEPRLSCWYGPPYKYSGIQHAASPLIPVLSELASNLSSEQNFVFNSVLLNLYKDGNDYMGWHSDNEPVIDQELIACISLGAKRTFKFRHNTSKEVINLDLPSGSLLLMRDMQMNWKHSLPKRKRSGQKRISLTFRRTMDRR
jgi:alkylated DNA repair dioxygenase AlkB